MADFIKREDVLAKIDEFVKLNAACGFPVDVFDIEMMKKMIEKIPAEDVATVVHGRWVEKIIPGEVPDWCCVCSICEGDGLPSYDYCPNCGAKMDIDEEGET